MYFPYVYGRSSELLALRAASASYLSSEVVIPIIEAVRQDLSALGRCLKLLGELNQPVIVIANPFQGDFKKSDPKKWKVEVLKIIDKYPSIIPGYQLRSNVTLASTQAFLNGFAKRNVALLYQNSGLDNTEVKTLASANNVRFHITLEGNISESHRKLIPKAKLVNVFDHFNKQARNADYGAAEPFSDSYLTFSPGSVGFGDYTVTGSEHTEGGGQPGAVAIHITYRHASKGKIWVEHFLSDETDRNESDAGTKYLDAVRKFAKEYKQRKVEFGINPALDAYLSDHALAHFPGLPKNKERQILHHIARVHDLLVS